MFLLIQTSSQIVWKDLPPLHSTMFLLILFDHSSGSFRRIPLHSTMFLLIPIPTPTDEPPTPFTFHDVSINTCFESLFFQLCFFFTFHDVSINTIRFCCSRRAVYDFTFHDVSINTSFLTLSISSLVCFTFHDVSINTVLSEPFLWLLQSLVLYHKSWHPILKDFDI